MHVAVIGAGITGMASAWTLVEAGHQVTLLDADEGPGRGASAQNGGQLSYAFVAPLASPATLAELPALLWRNDSPFRFHPGLSLRTWTWCMHFAFACTRQQSERTTRTLLSLSALSRERFADWRSRQVGNAIDFARNGKLVLYRSQMAWTAAQRQVALQRGIGSEQHLCSEQECFNIEPALRKGLARIVGGVLTPSEEVADCAAICVRIARDLERRAGYAARWGTAVTDFDISGGRVRGLRLVGQPGDDLLPCDAVVVANGIGAPALLSRIGARVPIEPLKGYSIELAGGSLQSMPRLSVTDSASKTVFAPLGSGDRARLRVAGMAELAGADARIDPRAIARLVGSAANLFGLHHGVAEVKPWAGFRPATPTGLPCIGPTRTHSNVWVNAGHGALGLTLAFGSAAVLLAQLRRGCTDHSHATALDVGPSRLADAFQVR